LQGFPCRHAMIVVKNEKKRVYDFVNVCNKSSTQMTWYMNSVHPMETHDMVTVDDKWAVSSAVKRLTMNSTTAFY